MSYLKLQTFGPWYLHYNAKMREANKGWVCCYFANRCQIPLNTRKFFFFFLSVLIHNTPVKQANASPQLSFKLKEVDSLSQAPFLQCHSKLTSIFLKKKPKNCAKSRQGQTVTAVMQTEKTGSPSPVQRITHQLTLHYQKLRQKPQANTARMLRVQSRSSEPWLIAVSSAHVISHSCRGGGSFSRASRGKVNYACDVAESITDNLYR